MKTHLRPDYYRNLVKELSAQKESECLEFKQNKADPEDMGEYISALANGAALHGSNCAYMIWGISDKTHEIVGTTFDYTVAKVGNEDLENWLLRLVEPKIKFSFHDVEIDGKKLVLLKIHPAYRHPVRFRNQEYIRIGSYKKKLNENPELERALWRSLDETPFEQLCAKKRVNSEEVLQLLDYSQYFDLLDIPIPDGHAAILKTLKEDNLIQECDAGGWNITNLGAILFAKRLEDFETLTRKAIRVIHYKGISRIETLQEQPGTKGYAAGFAGLIRFLLTIIPASEVIQEALRTTRPLYPEIAIRELVANALIHQDFSIGGAGPMVEIFEDRIEITNPGKPLVEPNRFLDNPPRSRNEILASLLRRFGICEERGSGIDKVVRSTELYQLPSPLFEVYEDSTRVVMFSPRSLTAMNKEDKVRACYWHACLQYVGRDFLTNTSLRQRFGVEEQNRAIVSRLIKDALDAKAIVFHDPDAPPKSRKYVPYWATSLKSTKI